MKIVVMADSLAMAREGETNVAYETTYPYLLDQWLRQRFGSQAPLVSERGMRRRTIEYVLDEWYELVDLRKTDVVVVHVGIVDCAPRVFLRRERQFVENLRPGFLRRSILDYVHRHRRAVVNMRKKVYVPPERFNALVGQVMAKAKASELRSLVIVNIITPPAEMDGAAPVRGSARPLLPPTVRPPGRAGAVPVGDQRTEDEPQRGNPGYSLDMPHPGDFRRGP
jgi:hypothetical protein